MIAFMRGWLSGEKLVSIIKNIDLHGNVLCEHQYTYTLKTLKYSA